MGKVYTDKELRKIPRVTTIIGQLEKHGLIHWASSIVAEVGVASAHQDASRDAAGIGTAIHAYLEARMSGMSIDDAYIEAYKTVEHPSDVALLGSVANPNELSMLDIIDQGARALEDSAVIEFCLDTGVAATETSMIDKDDEFRGTFDLLLKDGTLIDLKTSSNTIALYNTHVIQLAAYRSMINNSDLLPNVERAQVLLLDHGAKSGESRLFVADLTSDDLDAGYKAFKSLLDLYYNLKPVNSLVNRVKRSTVVDAVNPF